MLKTALALSVGVLLSGCAHHTDSAAPAPPSSPTAPVSPAAIEQYQAKHELTDQWVGRWIGVEGLNLTVSQDESAGPGHYLLKMQYGLDADQSGTFKGESTADGIAFERDDGKQLLRPGDGEATGLKWLMDKQNCLIVKLGEGYCRD